MIIKGANGNDEQRISQMEDGICRRNRIARRQLYPALCQADFHETYKDPAKFWSPPCYAAFSGQLLTHKLGYEGLKALLEDFTHERERLHPSWAVVVWDGLDAKGPGRTYRDSEAIAFRYAVAVADDYIWPSTDMPGKLSNEQFLELNAYLDYVGTNCLIPACKTARQACQRQLDDLWRSRAEERRAG